MCRDITERLDVEDFDYEISTNALTNNAINVSIAGVLCRENSLLNYGNLITLFSRLGLIGGKPIERCTGKVVNTINGFAYNLTRKQGEREMLVKECMNLIVRIYNLLGIRFI